ncbi:MAG: hypothetical protein UY27_C0023G0001, partial [Candidatus Gottesmanbacteria bacterium GW2011_GWA1_48_13]
MDKVLVSETSDMRSIRIGGTYEA